MNIDWCVSQACIHGDARAETYELLARQFTQAHYDARGGLSVEIGTRRGGSALLQLMLLEEIYKNDVRPMLVTVDPYGGKLYMGGNGQQTPGLYGDEEYIAAKRLLAPYGNHVHFSVTSLDFLLSLPRLWRAGEPLHIRDETISSVFLDGDHDTATIVGELAGFAPLLKKGGRVVIDNIDVEPGLTRTLDKLAPTLGLTRETCAVYDAAVLSRV